MPSGAAFLFGLHMEPNVKIVSDGTPRGTRVLTRSGEQLRGITGLDLSITLDSCAMAVIRVANAGFEIEAIAAIERQTPVAIELSFDEWMAQRVEREHQKLLRTYEDLSALDRRIAFRGELRECIRKQIRDGIRPIFASGGFLSGNGFNLGLQGEHGPEAIMPQTRNTSG